MKDDSKIIKGTSFSATESVNGKYNQKIGSITIAQRQETLSGFDIVNKQFSSKATREVTPAKWHQSQFRAAKIVNELAARNNPAYIVPHTFISHGNVRDTFIDGTPAAQLPSVFVSENKQKLIESVGQFLNDMSEMRPVKYKKRTRFANLINNSVEDLDATMAQFSTKVISDKNRKTIRDIYEYLRDLPENSEMVFTHNDLHANNIIINTDTVRVGIIDFELAGYAPKSWIMYKDLPHPKLWEYINRLGRATNPDLKWNWDPRINDLYRFIRNITMEMDACLQYNHQDEEHLALNIQTTTFKMARLLIGAKAFHTITRKKSELPACIIKPNSGIEF